MSSRMLPESQPVLAGVKTGFAGSWCQGSGSPASAHALPTAAVLRFDEAQHDATDRYQRFTAERRAAGGETTAIYRSRVGAGATKLDPVLRRLLRTTSGALLRDLGYLDGGR